MGKIFGGREVLKCRQRLRRYCQGNGLDLGCGSAHKINESAIGVDRGLEGVVNLAGDVKNLYWFKEGVLDYVFSSHCLEDFAYPEEAAEVLKEWLRVIKPEGFLVLYLPLKGFIAPAGSQGANQAHQHDYQPEDVLELLDGLGVDYKVVRKEVRQAGKLVSEELGYDVSFELVVKKMK